MAEYRVTLYQIRRLYFDMKQNGKVREQFHFEYNHIRFEAILLIDRLPFELLVGIIGHPLAFVLQMHSGFQVDPIPDDVFYRLIELLNLKPGKESFTSFIFLRHLDKCSPTRCSSNIVQPDSIARYKQDELAKVPEPDKKYFLGWVDNTKQGRQVRNLEKTRILLGEDVARFCQERNISSKWTAEPDKAARFYMPPSYNKRLK